MLYYRLNTALFLIVLLFISGCVTGAGSGLSGLSTSVRATPQERRGDIAYENEDYATAFAEYHRAAELGGPYGQFMLANMYLAGQGTPRNLDIYLFWMGQSADNGYPSANYLMGMTYVSSNPEDARRAITFFENAARQEHGGSMYMLGLMWASGTGIQQDSTEALRWFRMARAHGVPVEQEFLTLQGIESYAREIRQASASSEITASTHGETKSLVREIQQGLLNIGYDPGPVDGLYGNRTRAAIEAFQKDIGMHPDGAASNKVLDAIRSR